MGLKRRSYHLVNQKDFTTIKALFDANLSVSKIHEITGRSFGVIGLIKNSTTMNDYRQKVKETVKKYAERATRSTGSPTPKATQPELLGGKETLSDLVKALKEINTTLERLATAWESRPVKRGLFDR